MRPCHAALTIAGSDPSGGAGIQADLKTFTVLRVYGCAAITDLTVQNTCGVRSCNAVNPQLVFEQISTVLEDLPVSHIKIGMVSNIDVADAITEALLGFAGEVVYDPVITASTGQTLLGGTGLSAVKKVAQSSTVLTPNHNELQQLTNLYLTKEDSLAAASNLLAPFPKLRAVILKGGHIDEDNDTITDYLVIRQDCNNFSTHSASHSRLSSNNTHGTGCTFAAAFTAHHLHTKSYEQAFFKTVDFMDQLIEASTSSKLGKGNGGLVHYRGTR